MESVFQTQIWSMHSIVDQRILVFANSSYYSMIKVCSKDRAYTIFSLLYFQQFLPQKVKIVFEKKRLIILCGSITDNINSLLGRYSGFWKSLNC